MLHTYNHQLIFGGVVPVQHFLENVFHHVVLFVKSLFTNFYKDLMLIKKSFFQIARIVSSSHSFEVDVDFYFIGTMVLFCAFLYLMKVFFDLMEVAVFDKNQLDTRVFLLKKRLDELQSENKGLRSTVDLFQQDIKNYHEKYLKELRSLKKEIYKYD